MKSMSMVFRELCGKCWAKYFPTRNMMKSIEASKKLYRTNIYLLLKDFMGRWTKTTVNRFLCHRITNKVIKLSVATLYILFWLEMLCRSSYWRGYILWKHAYHFNNGNMVYIVLPEIFKPIFNILFFISIQ